jgi:hypothetical protein
MIMKHKISIFLAFVVVVLLSQIATTNVSADSTTVNGWTNQGSSGSFDFYFTPNAQVNPTELGMFVNYGDAAMSLQVTEGNKTIFTQNIDPHTSMFITISFPDVQTTYKIVVHSGGFTLLTLSKTAPGYYLPTQTDDSTWHITPPATGSTGLKQYTQSFVDNLIAMLTFQVLACVLISMVIGVFLGAAVRRAVYFFMPKDVLSIIVYIWVFSDLIFNWTKFGIGIYYLTFIAGYFIGWFISHISYVETETSDLANRSRSKQPVVVYQPNEEVGYGIQQQSNKALIKRWLGYHHRLGMDGPLSPDLADSTKYPYFPLFRKQILKIEDAATTYREEPIFFGLITIRVYKTYWQLSNVCTFPKDRWNDSCGVIIWARDMIRRLTSELTKERQTNYMTASRVSAEMIANTMDRSTHRAIYETFNKPIPPRTFPEPTENRLTRESEVTARPQRTPEDTEPERTEKKGKRNNEIDNESEPAMDREDEDSNVKQKKRRNDVNGQ